MPETATWSEAKCAHYEFSISIKASSERVWRALTDQIGSWWLPHFHMLGEDSIIEFEPRAGGRLFERNGNAELLWYTVLAIHPGKSLELAGYCSAKYGGPASTLLYVELVSLVDDTTVVKVSDSLFGRVSDEFVRSLRSGWQELFNDGLKKFIGDKLS